MHAFFKNAHIAHHFYAFAHTRRFFGSAYTRSCRELQLLCRLVNCKGDGGSDDDDDGGGDDNDDDNG